MAKWLHPSYSFSQFATDLYAEKFLLCRELFKDESFFHFNMLYSYAFLFWKICYALKK